MKIFFTTFAASVALLLNSSSDALNVKLSGVNYGAHPDGTICQSAEQVEQAMVALQKVADTVRIQSLSNCNQAELVLPAAKKAGLKVQLGVATGPDPSLLNTEKEKLRSLIQSGLVDENVIGMSVGHNGISRKEVTAAQAIANMNDIRSVFTEVGRNMSLTISDTIESYVDNPIMYRDVDFMSITYLYNIENTDVDEAVATALDRIYSVRLAAVNKQVEVAEIGWSSGIGVTTGSATPANQSKFLSNLVKAFTALRMNFFWSSGFDEPWHSNAIERYFGLHTANGTLKSHIDQLVITFLDPRVINIHGLFLSVSSFSFGSNKLTMEKLTNYLPSLDEQTFFIDYNTNQVRSLSSDRCLTCQEPVNGNLPVILTCKTDDNRQKWTYNTRTRQIQLVSNPGICLDVDRNQNNLIQVWDCATDNPNQMFNLSPRYSV
ncbi:uncharacterized protein CCR75_006557 [Bremia lactucae]|uniref:glucan endo-1,3-beta-D-glucosidase n=1 Tax=Bremia lactucae TaxID=4779 RepID=A0A976IDF1_BRELC|nr:hypothetical protein CCR75_006557 [Bremia lactucae]